MTRRVENTGPAANRLPAIDVGADIRPLEPYEFDQIRRLAYKTFGLDLRSGKEDLVSARLRRLVRDGAFHSFDEYYKHVLNDGTGLALSRLIDALATNHTSFCREADHFEFLRTEVLPRLASRSKVEIWSAACSTGEEVWTLACLLNDVLQRRNFSVTATDISRKALAAAERACYPAERCAGMPGKWLSLYFQNESSDPRAYQVKPWVRSQATFQRINLVEPMHWGKTFPVVFCRNVMIYFDRPTQERVLSNLFECLEPGGYLFVGHAESLTRVSHRLDYVRPAVYRKPGAEKRWNRSS